MHVRPAMKLFEQVQKFKSKVILRSMRNDKSYIEAEANSVIALLMLDSAKDGEIEIEVSGRDEIEALEAVIELFNSGFDED